MQKDLDMNSYLIHQPKLGGNLNLNDKWIYNNDLPLCSSSAHGMTMQNAFNIDGHVIHQPKLGGNLNLNKNAVYNNDTLLFRYQNGVIHFSKPVFCPGMVYRLKNGPLSHAVWNQWVTFSMPSFGEPYTASDRISGLRLYNPTHSFLHPGELRVVFNVRNRSPVTHTMTIKPSTSINTVFFSENVPIPNGALSVVFSMQGLLKDHATYLEVDFVV